MKTALLIALTGLAVSAACPAAEPEPATLSYRTLCQMAQLDFSDTIGFTNRNVRFFVGSSNPDIAATDIKMHIDSASGRVDLPLGPAGLLVLPIDKNLFEENPLIVANQPKGSMTLESVLEISGELPDSLFENDKGLVRYSALFVAERIKRRIVADLTELRKERNIEEAMGKPTIIRFTAGTNLAEAAITVLSKNTKTDVVPVEPGVFVMKFDSGLMDEDPWVRLEPGCMWSAQVEMEEN